MVEVGTGSGVGSLWLLDGMIASGTLTSIDDEMEHAAIAKIAFAEAEIAAPRFRLITNVVMDVMTKLADRAYDLVVYRHNPEDLTYAIPEAHRILRHRAELVSHTHQIRWRSDLRPRPPPADRGSRTRAGRDWTPATGASLHGPRAIRPTAPARRVGSLRW